MELACGDVVYIEATIHRHVTLEVINRGIGGASHLTTEEARVLANALLAAVVEAENYSTELTKE